MGSGLDIRKTNGVLMENVLLLTLNGKVRLLAKEQTKNV